MRQLTRHEEQHIADLRRSGQHTAVDRIFAAIEAEPAGSAPAATAPPRNLVKEWLTHPASMPEDVRRRLDTLEARSVTPPAPVLTELQRECLAHPNWSAYAATSPALREAIDNDFGRFCDLKARGLLDSLNAYVARESSRTIRETLRFNARLTFDAYLSPTTFSAEERERHEAAQAYARRHPEAYATPGSPTGPHQSPSCFIASGQRA